MVKASAGHSEMERRTASHDGGKSEALEKVEAKYKELMHEPMSRAHELGAADIVVGIPFYNETDTIVHVIDTATAGLNEYYPDLKCVVVAAGSPVGSEALAAIGSLPQDDRVRRLEFLLDDPDVNGKGWSVRATAEIAMALGADHVVIEADLRSLEVGQEIEGLAPDWIPMLLDPIRRGKADIVVSRFLRHHLEFGPNLLVFPVLTAVYGKPIRRVVGSQWAMSHPMLRKYLKDAGQLWRSDIAGYGIDCWMAISSIISGARIYEANLGIKLHKPSTAKNELILRQVAEVLLARIVADESWWHEPDSWGRQTIIEPLPIVGPARPHQPVDIEIAPGQLIAKFQRNFNRYHPLYRKIFPEDTYGRLENLATSDAKWFDFPTDLWAQTTYHLILAYAFGKEFARGDIIDSIVHLHCGFLGSLVLSMETLGEKLEPLPAQEAEHLLRLEAEHRFDELAQEFVRQRPAFAGSWQISSEALKPPVPQVTYREFVPGVPLVVPTELTAPDGRVVCANEVYDRIFSQLRRDFDEFVHQRLGVPEAADSEEITAAIRSFLRSVEASLLPELDLSGTKDTERMVEAIFENFPHGQAFSLIPELASRFLAYYPPLGLITKLGYEHLDDLLEQYDPLDVLALANWTEEPDYIQNLWQTIADGLRSEHFAPCEIKPLVVSHEDFPSLVEMKDSSALDKLTSRIVVSNLHKGMGGEFPKLRYLTTIAKNIVEAERFGEIWRRFAQGRKDFGRKVVDSIAGHWGRDSLSAHNIFEDGHQRIVVDRVRRFAERIKKQAASERDDARAAMADNLLALAESYHLALSLPDGKFVTCSAWSWASYSFKGGTGAPPPLSLHVERDWASREFLVEYFKAIGGTEEEVDEKIIELIEQGRERENLAAILLGTEKGAERVVPREPPALISEQSPASSLKRIADNPILEPIKEHAWESKYVLNAGTIRLNGRVYMVYRAFGDDEVSRLGLAVSRDGLHFTERLDSPIFEPRVKSEQKGCEDPRLTLIEDRVYMAYTAYDGMVAQIALASIGVRDFLQYRWGAWRRHGLVFPGFDDKDAALFPELFNGKYAMLHRVDPHIWITFSPHLRCPWPRKEHRILAGTTTGLMWDGRKIGAGAQPIKTKYGWLLITHGVDYAHVYRLGVMLLDLKDPSRLIYRSPNCVLEPVAQHELGSEDSWVPNVVFTCGALPVDDGKEILSADDELIVYYGSADTVMSAATAKVGDLVPEEFR